MGEAKKEEQARQELVDLGASTTKTSRGTIYTLTIIGQIEGHQALPENIKTTKYEHVIPLLAAVEESEDIDGLLLLLNTVGGDIEAGLAIAELIAGMKKPTVSLVLGGGHSIGIPLAVSARKSLIVPTASMTVHPVRMTGLVVGAPQTYQYFNQIQDQIVNFVTKNSHISREDFLRYMMATDEIATDVGTVLYGEEAVSSGLMDAIASYLSSYKDEGFVVAKFVKADDPNWLLTVEDGNGGCFASQCIEFTDFPLDEITLYVIKQDDLWVVLLPSEY